MKNYYRIMAGKKSVHAKTCLNGNFIGADFDIAQDLTNKLPDEWRAFSKEFIPKILETVPGKTKIGAAHDCVALWKVSKGIVKGDIVLCPDGAGTYRVGEISGDYFYAPGDVLPHRRPVRWLDASIARADMSDALKKSTSSASTLMDASRYREEIEKFIGGVNPPPPDETVEDAVEFALEKHLEDFLVQNWAHTELGKNFDIVEADGGQVGQQFPTDTGSIDILAIRKDKKELLIVELKKGRASDAVVGQILRYMGFVLHELAEKGQTVKGVIIAMEDDPRIRRALSVTPNIDFYRYQISFKLLKDPARAADNRDGFPRIG